MSINLNRYVLLPKNKISSAMYNAKARNRAIYLANGYAQRQRNARNARRRIRRKQRRTGGLEINKADGGEKQLTLPYRSQGIGINLYGRLAAVKVGDEWKYAFQPEYDNFANHSEYNLAIMLNNSDEFVNRLKTTSQYLINKVNISISYNRTPSAGDLMPKLLLYVSTTKITVYEPKIQNNVMRLNMNQLGTKNFNFKLNKQVITDEFVGWQNGSDLYGGNIFLHVVAEDKMFLDTSETTVVLGTVKVTFSIKTRIQDFIRNQRATLKKTKDEEIKELKERIRVLESKLSAEKQEEEDSGSEYEGDEEFIRELAGDNEQLNKTA
jgi:hypothetical protein